MIRHQLARILSAIADRLEGDTPEPQIQYVYVYSAPPITTTPTYTPPWQSPWYSSPNTCNHKLNSLLAHVDELMAEG